MSSGVHYRGKTTTALYDGATTNPISISGSSYTAESGDLVIVDLSSIAATYATGTAYSQYEYIVSGGIYYIVTSAITASENTSLTAIASKINVVSSDPEFLYDGSTWAALGSIADGLGDLAFQDTASGTYVKPTGSGTVSINTYTPSTKSLATTTITGTNGTVSASNITNVASSAFALAASSSTTVATAGTATYVGNADVGDSVTVVTGLSDSTSFNTDAINSATLTGTTEFSVGAIKSASLNGTTTFATSGITTAVSGDCLTFSTASTGTVGIETDTADTGIVGISTTAASTASVSLSTTSITPAKAVSSTSTSIIPVGGTTSILGVSGTSNAVTGITYSTVSPAAAASSATTVATGSLETGSDIVVGLTSSTESATVTVGTTSDTVTVS